MKQLVFLVWSVCFLKSASSQSLPIGTWREFLPYNQVTSVVRGNDGNIYASTPYAVFIYDPSGGSIKRLSKMTGLTGTGISSIGLTGDFLVIAYANSSIDIKVKEKIYNIDDIRRSNLTGDKHIYSIYCNAGKAYLCTGFGIVVVDLSRAEISDTYLIGNNGMQVRVWDLTSDDQFFFAATDEGMKKASKSGSNLSDFKNWQTLSPGSFRAVVNAGPTGILALRNDSLLKVQNSFSFFYYDGFPIRTVNYSNDQFLLAEGTRGVILNNDGTVRTVLQNSKLKSANELILAGDYWAADSTAGLLRIAGNTVSAILPDGPVSEAGKALAVNDDLLVTSGVGAGNISVLENNIWTNYTSSSIRAFDSIHNISSIAIDPVDNSFWGGSFGGGLFHFVPGTSITVFRNGFPDNVGGLAFDSERNLWITDYGAAQELFVLRQNGSTQRFTIPYAHTQNAVSDVLVDDFDQKWIISPNGNGLFVFNGSQWRYFRYGSGNGNLPSNTVLSIAKDQNGFLWVGTASGIGIIPCSGDVFNTACQAISPVVQQGSFNGYLFRDEQVQTIAVDGADRKWIGTRNGAWLISADGEKVIDHFTSDNSPLLSDDIKKIAVNGRTGEVFFSTANGLCSFRGTATAGGEKNSNVLVFPNPVPHAYNGTIAIRGLSTNAIVKITTVDGRLIYETRALGGQAVWNGKDYRGRKISSGVFLVLIRNSAGTEYLATRIVFIH